MKPKSRVLVTGATSGIGLSLVKRLVEEGHQVIATGRRVPRPDLFPQRVSFHVADLECRNAIDCLLHTVNSRYGGVDVLVNNAGAVQDSLALQMTDEAWDRILRINLDAVFLLSRGVLLQMLKRKRGNIINVSSIIGARGNQGQANYASAKAGVIALTQSMASEVAHRGIRVNCVAPGFINTPMLSEREKLERVDALRQRIPMKRLGEPEEVAEAILFLMGEASSYITGSVLHVDGGLSGTF